MRNNIKVIRQAKRLSQQSLADRAGLSRLTIVNAEAGTSEPKIETGNKIAQALGVNFEDLFFNQNVHLDVQGLRDQPKETSK